MRYSFVVCCFVSASSLSFVTTDEAQADSFSLDYGNVAASGQQITISRLPIVKKGGQIVYRDVTIRFGSKKQKLFVKKSFSKTKKSPQITSADLVAGKYYLDGYSYTYELIGPGVGPNAREVWTLVGVSDDDDAEMTFYSGPVNGHPLQVRLNDAGIESSPYTFGESTDDGYLSSYFGHECLVSAYMISDVLRLNSHSNSGCYSDYINPTDTATLRRCTPEDNCD